MGAPEKGLLRRLVAMPRPDPSELQKVIDFTAREAGDVPRDRSRTGPVRDPRADEVAATFGGPLPEQGVGAVANARGAGRRDRRRRALRRTEVLPLRRRGDDPRRARSRLARDHARPEPGRVGVDAARRRGWSRSRSSGSRSCSGCRRRGAACSRPAPRWPTSSRSRARAGGAPSARAWTSTTSAWPRRRRSPCSAAATPIRATSRRSACSASVAAACASSSRDDVGRVDLDAMETGAPRARRSARDRDRQRRRGERRRLRPARTTWPTWPNGTAPGSTWTGRSGCSRRCHRGRSTWSRVSSAPTR